MITKNDINTTITCDKCQKQQSASNQNYNKIFWIYKWVFIYCYKYVLFLFYILKNIIMDCQRPIKNKETGKWEVWDFAYEENGERYYELHEFFEYKDAIEFWKIRNPKQK